ncbi:MAG: hypothetical protein HYY06_06140 [Deltaproteobacteria bacterium]|nr:hypothetical protein [Deltaproteobacteria bacterium]
MVLRLAATAVVLGFCGCIGEPIEVGEHRAPVLAAGDLLYEDRFETCDTGWSPSGTGSTWQCGAPAAEPPGDSDGTGLAWATALDGPYGRYEQSALTSPEIDLSASTEGGGELRLSISVWYDFSHNPAQDFGGARVEAFDGLSWRVIEPHGGWDGPFRAPGTPLDGALGLTDSGLIRTWRSLVFDIGDLAGPTFRLRVVVANRHPHRASGIAVDSVRIERIGSPAARATGAIEQLRAEHRDRIAQGLAGLSTQERTRKLNHLFWRGIAPAEPQVRRNVFGAIGSLTGPFLRLPHTKGVARTTAGEAAQTFLDEFGRDLFGAEPVDSLVMDQASPALAKGPPGAVIFEQRFAGLPVLAARAEVFLDRELRVYRAFGTVVPGFSVDPTPSIDSRRASRIAREAAEVETGGSCEAGAADLVGWNGALAGGADEDRLAWRLPIECTAGQERVVLVDGHDGTVLHTHDPVRLFAEDVPGFAIENFGRFGEEEEDCFGPRGGCPAEVVWRDGECLWHYDIVAGSPVAGGQRADAQHLANCDQVAETDQIIRAFDAMGDYITSQVWNGGREVSELVSCDLADGVHEGFCFRFNVPSSTFGDSPTIGYNGAGRVIFLRPDVGGPDIVGHEASHAISATLGTGLSSAVEEHLADIHGAIATARALGEGFGEWYEPPDAWSDGGTAESAAVLVEQAVIDAERACSMLDFAGDEDAPERLVFSEDLPEDDPRRPQDLWRSLSYPWRSNRGHCAGAGSLNEEWQSGGEAYAQYYEPGTSDGEIATRGDAIVLGHTNLGIGNRMLYLFTEGGRSRGFRVEPQGFAELEATIFGTIVSDILHTQEDGAGIAASWSLWASSLAQAACDLEAELGEGPGCDLEINDRAEAITDAAAAVSLWSEPTELTSTEAAVGQRLAAVSYVAPGASERVYVFYRGTDELDELGNAPVHYRWLDVSPSRYLGTPLADGEWHPREGDCVVPGSATAEGPTAAARSDSLWVAWVEGSRFGGRVHSRSFAELPENPDDCVPEGSWSAPKSPAVQDAELFPDFFSFDSLHVQGPVALVDVPIAPPDSGVTEGAHCLSIEAPPDVAFPFAGVGVTEAASWDCRMFPGGIPFIDDEFSELGRIFQEVINPDPVRATIVFGIDPEAPGRTEEAIGPGILFDPLPYASVDSSLRAALESSTLGGTLTPPPPPSDLPGGGPGVLPLGSSFGALFADALDGSGLNEGSAQKAQLGIVQQLLPLGSAGAPQSVLREVSISFPRTELFLVWRDPSGQVFIHPWDLVAERTEIPEAECELFGGVFRNGQCLTDQLEPVPVMSSSIAPAAVAHQYRDGFGARHGIYVVGADDDGAVTVTHSTNEAGTLDGLMEFGPEQVLPLTPDPDGIGPRPPLYRAWTDRPVALWSRPARGSQRGTLHFVVFPSRFDPDSPPDDPDPFLPVQRRRLGFEFRPADGSPLLAGVMDTETASGGVELRSRERLFSLEDTDAVDDRFDDVPHDPRFPEPIYRPAPGGGIVSNRDVVFYFDAARVENGRAAPVVSLSVRAKVGQ